MKAVVVASLVVMLTCVTLFLVARNHRAERLPAEAPDAANSGKMEVALDQLICITSQRIPVAIQKMVFCRPAPDFGPHEVPEILIYTNQLVLDHRRNYLDNVDIPIGSTFVKTKFASPDATEPNLATMMVRRAASGRISDWEFSSFSLPDKKPLGPTNDASCIGCHEGYADHGFISWETAGALRRHLKLE
jgi:hypothetical protein